MAGEETAHRPTASPRTGVPPWPRGKALTFCAEILVKVLQDLGVQRPTAMVFKAVWNIFAQVSKRNGCCLAAGEDVPFSGEVINNIHRLNVNKIITLLYVSIVASGDGSVELFDIARWLKEGHLPGKLMTSCFPPDRVLEVKDKWLFVASGLNATPGGLSDTCAFLGITQCPARNWDSILKRILLDFHLPMELHRFIRSTILSKLPDNSECPLNWPEKASRKALEKLDDPSWRHGPKAFGKLDPPEISVCAAILLSLKWLFGLDDCAEYVISKAASEAKAAWSSIQWHQHHGRQELIALEKPFLFSEWLDFIQYQDLVLGKLNCVMIGASSSCMNDGSCAGMNGEAMIRRMSRVEISMHAPHMWSGLHEREVSRRMPGPPSRDPPEPEFAQDSVVAELRAMVRRYPPWSRSDSADVPLKWEAMALFKPSSFPRRSTVDAFLSNLEKLQALRSLPCNKKAVPENFLARLDEELLRKTFTDANLVLFEDPVETTNRVSALEKFFPRASPVAIGIRQTIENLDHLAVVRKRAQASFWVLPLDLKFGHLGRNCLVNFQILLSIFSRHISCPTEDLFAEFFKLERACVLLPAEGNKKGKTKCYWCSD